MQPLPEKLDMMKLMMGAAAPTSAAAAAENGFVPTLVRTLSAQKSLYVELLTLARQQSQYVLTGETESLMTVLSARSRLIDRVSPLDKQLQPYKGRWQEVLDSLGTRDRMVVAGLLKEVQQLLGDILAQDEKDKESLTQQKSQVGQELQRTVTGATLNRAYGVKPRVGAVLG